MNGRPFVGTYGFVFFKNRRADLVKKHFLGEHLLWNFISAINKWPIVWEMRVWEMLSRIWLNSRRIRVFIFWYSRRARAWSWPDYIGYIRPSLKFLLWSFFSRLHYFLILNQISIYFCQHCLLEKQFVNQKLDVCLHS